MKNNQIDSFHIGVKALIVNQEKKILLLERDHPTQKMYWDIPGGRLHKGDSLIDTLLREIKEEIGLDDLKEIHPFTMALTNIRIPSQEGSVGLIFAIYHCDISFPFIPILSSEHVNFGWFSPLEAIAKFETRYPSEFLEKLARLH